MRLYDENEIVEIRMYNGKSNADFAEDFFDAGMLEYNSEYNASRVNDVCYCILQALCWVKGEGDFLDDKKYYDFSNREVKISGVSTLRR